MAHTGEAMSFSRILVLDWETSGIPSDNDLDLSYTYGPQGIELAAVVVDAQKWIEMGEFSTRVRFIQGMEWSSTAERVHGISQSEASTGPMPHTAFERFDEFLVQYFDRNVPILIAGQNPGFDRWFTHQLFWLAGYKEKFPWRFHSRMLDTFSIGYLAWGCTTGNDLYERVCGVRRTRHSAYEDACLGAAVICEAFRLNISPPEDSNVPDQEIHPSSPAGDPSKPPAVWEG